VIAWTLADLVGRTCPAKRREGQRGALEAADAELRRLIREAFERGIPGEQLAQSAELSMSRVYQIRDGGDNSTEWLAVTSVSQLMRYTRRATPANTCGRWRARTG
jgi:hypothetical protein